MFLSGSIINSGIQLRKYYLYGLLMLTGMCEFKHNLVKQLKKKSKTEILFSQQLSKRFRQAQCIIPGIWSMKLCYHHAGALMRVVCSGWAAPGL